MSEVAGSERESWGAYMHLQQSAGGGMSVIRRVGRASSATSPDASHSTNPFDHRCWFIAAENIFRSCIKRDI